jgi:hypothetical protein
MRGRQLRDLRTLFKEHVATMRARGVALLSYQTPCCGGMMQTPAADEGEVRNTCVTCIYCGSLFHRASTTTTVNINEGIDHE